MTTTPKKYRPENQSWSPTCRKKNCKEETIICPVCVKELNAENMCHVDIYIDSSRQTETKIGGDIVYKHAHFVLDEEKGRNVWCLGKQIMIPKSICKISWVLDRKKRKPSWLIKKLRGED